jgi:ribulose-phosphate 3-epimerase
MGALRELKGDKAFLLAPSILDADQLSLEDSIRSIESELDWIHIDVMDGHFVPNLSYGPRLVKAVRDAFPDAFIDVHLMAEPAENFVDMFAAAEPDLLTIHVEATRHIHRVLQSIRSAGLSPGISINPGTPVVMVEPLLRFIDLVLVMSVNPGFGAQKFIPEITFKLKELVRFRAANSLDYLIEVDGGVRVDNAAFLVSSGCDVLVAGSAIFKDDDPLSAAARLKKSVSNG